MNSKAGFEARIAGAPAITPRDDVNKAVLADEPMLNYVSTEVLPITAYRPGLSAYTEVSSALQEATAAVTSGTPVDEAMADYAKTVEKIVGAENVAK
jgi:multiple sugar transport system substrate-binding protein